MDRPKNVFVRKILQKDNFRFSIEWTDGKTNTYYLHDMQRNCPCASCRDEKTGMPLADPDLLDKEVQAVRIYNVGKYALRVDFTSGCSKGIYTFSLLRKLALC